MYKYMLTKGKGKKVLIERLGYFNADISCRYMTINTLRLGYWMNKGSLIKKPNKFVKYVINLLIEGLYKKG